MPNLTIRTLNAATVTDTARNQFEIDSFRRVELWEKQVPHIAAEYAAHVAQKTGATEAETAELFAERSEGLRVYLGGKYKGEAGFFNAFAWTAIVGGGLSVVERHTTLVHEIGHALSVNRVVYLGQDHYKQSGIDRVTSNRVPGEVVPYRGDYSEWWINEGIIDLATQHVDNGRGTVGYITEVIMLLSLFDLNKDSESEIYRSAFFSGDSNRAVEVVDGLTYEGWAAEVGEHMHYMNTHSPDDNPQYNPIHEVAQTLCPEMKALANKHYSTIYQK